MISLDKLILDYKKINSINRTNFKNGKIEDNSFILIGKFIELYNSFDDLNKLLLLENNDKQKLSILKLEVIEFLKKYESNNVFFENSNRRKIEEEILLYYNDNVLFSIKSKKKEALKKYIYFQEKIKENAEEKITEDEKKLNTYYYKNAREKFESISEEIAEIDRYVIFNIRYINFKYVSIFDISNHIKKNLNIDETYDETYIDIFVLSGLYKLCNKYIFEDVSEDVFLNFFNLKHGTPALKIKKSKLQYVHYVINMLYVSNKEFDTIELWRNKILNHFGWDLNEHMRRRNYLTKKIDNIHNFKDRSKLKNEETKLEEFYTNFHEIIEMKKKYNHKLSNYNSSQKK